MIKQEKIQETLLRLCEHYGEQNWWQSDNKIEDLVSTILIQRTTEKNAKLALAGLMDVMTVEEILALPLEELQERIRPAGFFKQKSQTIRGLLIWLREVGGFEVLSKIGTEELRKQLLELKGIGPETADALLLYLFDRPVFISDEYTRRLFRRLGFGNFDTYNDMHAVYGNVLEGLTLKNAKRFMLSLMNMAKLLAKVKAS